MKLLILFLIILVIVVIILLAGFYTIKFQIRSVTDQIKDINRGEGKNISISLINSDAINLALEVNNILESKENLKFQMNNREKELKESIENISHDFRTPLTSIIGYIQLLEKSDLDENQRRYLNIAGKKSKDLKELVDVFFELSVLENNDIVPNFKRLNLNNLLADVILENTKIIEDSNLDMKINIIDEPLFIYADEFMIKRVVQNLIGNAIKYAKDDLIIDLSKEDKNKVRFKVKNGIQSEKNIDSSKIFERFYREDKARGRKGTGLGLSIVKILVEKMNGRVSARTEKNSLEITVEFDKE